MNESVHKLFGVEPRVHRYALRVAPMQPRRIRIRIRTVRETTIAWLHRRRAREPSIYRARAGPYQTPLQRRADVTKRTWTTRCACLQGIDSSPTGEESALHTPEIRYGVRMDPLLPNRRKIISSRDALAAIDRRISAFAAPTSARYVHTELANQLSS